MKPSERIYNLYLERAKFSVESLARFNAILAYLDEEHEKKQKEEIAKLVQKDIRSNINSKLI